MDVNLKQEYQRGYIANVEGAVGTEDRCPLFIDIIESRLRELSPDVFAPPISTSDLIRFEMTDSGNIHLYAMIDGQEKRRVFTKKSEQYEAVLGAMKKTLSREEQKLILEKLFRDYFNFGSEIKTRQP